MNTLLLDTHVWFWYALGVSKLSPAARKVITHAAQNHSLYIAAISLWELAMLEERKRITLGMPCLEWINQSIEKISLQVAPVTSTIAVESCNLPGKLHADPADKLIIATARVENLKLLTRDEKILEYGRHKYLMVMPA